MINQDQIELITVLTKARDTLDYIIKLWLAAIIVIAGTGIVWDMNMTIASDATKVRLYNLDMSLQGTQQFAEEKRQILQTNCYEFGGTKNGIYGKCSVNPSNETVMKHFYEIDEIEQRIKARNDSFRQWKWFGNDPITIQ